MTDVISCAMVRRQEDSDAIDLHEGSIHRGSHHGRWRDVPRVGGGRELRVGVLGARRAGEDGGQHAEEEERRQAAVPTK